MGCSERLVFHFRGSWSFPEFQLFLGAFSLGQNIFLFLYPQISISEILSLLHFFFFFWKSSESIGLNSLFIWDNSTMRPSNLGFFFVGRFWITDLIFLLAIGLFQFSLSQHFQELTISSS